MNLPRRLGWALVAWLAWGGPAVLFAMGTGEDPSEVLTKTWTFDQVKTLEIRGQIEMELRQGPSPRLTVVASRALFDQLSVSDWWGWTSVAIESGLMGPREKGKVKVVWEVPTLEELTVSDHSSALVEWPADQGILHVRDGSGVTLVLASNRFSVDAVWHSSVTLSGKVRSLALRLERESAAEASRLEAGDVDVLLDQSSVYRPGATTQGKALSRHGSRMDLPDGAQASWTVVQEAP